METMKAIICGKYGSPEVLHIEQSPKPIPREDEVLIKMEPVAVEEHEGRSK